MRAWALAAARPNSEPTSTIEFELCPWTASFLSLSRLFPGNRKGAELGEDAPALDPSHQPRDESRCLLGPGVASVLSIYSIQMLNEAHSPVKSLMDPMSKALLLSPLCTAGKRKKAQGGK